MKEKNDVSDEIVIRFALTKGDGDFPSGEELTADEIASPQSICSFYLDLDYEKIGEDALPFPLEEITILYDGIKEYCDSDLQGKGETKGLYWDDKQGALMGYPAPIIKFNFSQPVNKESFLYLVNASSVNICAESQKEDECSGYYFENHNGWVQILEGSNLKSWLKFLKDKGIFSGKKIKHDPNENIFPLASE